MSPLQPNARGLSALPTAASGGRTFTLTLDLCRHAIVLWVSDESPRRASAERREHRRASSPARRDARAARASVRLQRHGQTRFRTPFPLPRTPRHAIMTANSAGRFREALAAMLPVFQRFRAGFTGKASPVHFWWGSFDLSVSLLLRPRGAAASRRMSRVFPTGSRARRTAARSRAAASGRAESTPAEPFFYSYIYPEPPGYREAKVAHGRFDETFGEFVLPYADVRSAADPERCSASSCDRRTKPRRTWRNGIARRSSASPSRPKWHERVRRNRFPILLHRKHPARPAPSRDRRTAAAGRSRRRAPPESPAYPRGRARRHKRSGAHA